MISERAMANFVLALACMISVVMEVEAGTPAPSTTPTPKPTSGPTQAPTEYTLPPAGSMQPSLIYGVFLGVVFVMWMVSEIVARMRYWHDLELARIQDELNNENSSVDEDEEYGYKLQNYLLSIFVLDRGVFSEDNKFSRVWHELSSVNPWFAIYNTEVNGPTTLGHVEEHDEHEDVHDAIAHGAGDQTMASGSWNRFVRALRLFTTLCLASTLIGIWYYIQYPSIDQGLHCFDMKHKSDCEDEKIVFLGTTYYCKWYDDTEAINWGLDDSNCSFNNFQTFDLLVCVMSALFTAVLLSLIHWPLDMIFESLIVSPRRKEYGTESVQNVAFLVGAHQERISLTEHWDSEDNAAALESQQEEVEEDPVKMLAAKATKDLKDIIRTMENVRTYRETLTDPLEIRRFDVQWGITSSQMMPSTTAEAVQGEETKDINGDFEPEGAEKESIANLHFAGVARAIDDEDFFNAEYWLGSNSDVLNVYENEFVKKLEAEKKHLPAATSTRKVMPMPNGPEINEKVAIGGSLDIEEVRTPEKLPSKGGKGSSRDNSMPQKSPKKSKKGQFYAPEQQNMLESQQEALDQQLTHEKAAAEAHASNFVAALPVRCSTGYIETSYLEMRMAEAKRMGEEISLQIKETAHSQRGHQDHTTLETSVGQEVARFFAVDMMGGLQELHARTYLQKVESLFHTTALRRLRLNTKVEHIFLGLIFFVNVACITTGALLFQNGTIYWEYWWASCVILWLLLDMFVLQTVPAMMCDYLIPSMARNMIRKTMSEVIPLLCNLWKHHKVVRDIAVPDNQLSAPRDLFISRKIADSFPMVFESHLIRAYNTVWPKELQEKKHQQNPSNWNDLSDEEEEEDFEDDPSQKGSWGVLRPYMLRFGNLPLRFQRMSIALTQPSLALFVCYIASENSSDSTGVVAASLAIFFLVFFIPIVLGVAFLCTCEMPNWCQNSLYKHRRQRLTPDAAHKKSNADEDVPVAVAEEIKDGEDESEAKSLPISVDDSKDDVISLPTPDPVKEDEEEDWKTFLKEHPEENLEQYSSEDEDAFGERVRMRMLANERRKKANKNFRSAGNKVKNANRLRAANKSPPVTSPVGSSSKSDDFNYTSSDESDASFSPSKGSRKQKAMSPGSVRTKFRKANRMLAASRAFAPKRISDKSIVEEDDEKVDEDSEEEKRLARQRQEEEEEEFQARQRQMEEEEGTRHEEEEKETRSALEKAKARSSRMSSWKKGAKSAKMTAMFDKLKSVKAAEDAVEEAAELAAEEEADREQEREEAAQAAQESAQSPSKNSMLQNKPKKRRSKDHDSDSESDDNTTKAEDELKSLEAKLARIEKEKKLRAAIAARQQSIDKIDTRPKKKKGKKAKSGSDTESDSESEAEEDNRRAKKNGLTKLRNTRLGGGFEVPQKKKKKLKKKRAARDESESESSSSEEEVVAPRKSKLAGRAPGRLGRGFTGNNAMEKVAKKKKQALKKIESESESESSTGSSGSSDGTGSSYSSESSEEIVAKKSQGKRKAFGRK